VRALQHGLLALGFDAGVPDGSFEAKTRDAVAAFQRDAGLASDGVVGAVTAEALAAALGRRAVRQASVARDGLADAAGARRLPAEAAARYVGVLDDVLGAFDGLTLGRAANLGLVLDDVAAHADAYDEPRSLALFTMLEANAEHLTARDPPEESADIAGDDGVVYRFFRSRGFQFHPIANLAALNRLVTRGEKDEARRLATALVARAVPDGEGSSGSTTSPSGARLAGRRGSLRRWPRTRSRGSARRSVTRRSSTPPGAPSAPFRGSSRARSPMESGSGSTASATCRS
jgi:hypothetical protein